MTFLCLIIYGPSFELLRRWGKERTKRKHVVRHLLPCLMNVVSRSRPGRGALQTRCVIHARLVTWGWERGRWSRHAKACIIHRDIPMRKYLPHARSYKQEGHCSIKEQRLVPALKHYHPGLWPAYLLSLGFTWVSAIAHIDHIPLDDDWGGGDANSPKERLVGDFSESFSTSRVAEKSWEPNVGQQAYYFMHLCISVRHSLFLLHALSISLYLVSFCTSLHLHLYLQLSLSLHQSFHSCIFYLSISLSLSHNLSGPIISPSLYSPITLSIGPSLSTSLTLLAPPSLHHSLYWPLPIYITLAIIGFSSVGSFIITSMHVKERRPDWAEWGQWSDGESIRPIKWTIRH